jgi:ParB/RepB/Spo0J family partition protein
MTTTAIETPQQLTHIPLANIRPDPAQPRQKADAELADSIRAQGILEPILVRPDTTSNPTKGEAPFIIVDGERRWRGATEAKLETIPAIIRADAADEAQRLAIQTTANTGKPLTPLEEAKAWKRIQELTGKNANELAKLLGRSKSTVGDRLALAEAPEVFQALFAQGAFTAAAAPVTRKFAKVPPKILDNVVTRCCRNYNWSQYIRAQKPIPLNLIETELGQELAWDGVQAVPKNLAALFEGDTFDVGDQKMTADKKALAAAESKYDREQAKVAAKAGVKKGEKPAKEKEERWERERRASERKWQREQAERRAQSARFNKARPRILAAFAAALKKAPTGISANSRSAVADLVLKECSGQGATKDVVALLPIGANAESIMRHAAFLCIADVSCNSYLRERQMPQLAKRFGVDLRKIIDEVSPLKAEKAKASKKPKGGKGKR